MVVRMVAAFAGKEQRQGQMHEQAPTATPVSRKYHGPQCGLQSNSKGRERTTALTRSRNRRNRRVKTTELAVGFVASKVWMFPYKVVEVSLQT